MTRDRQSNGRIGQRRAPRGPSAACSALAVVLTVAACRDDALTYPDAGSPQLVAVSVAVTMTGRADAQIEIALYDTKYEQEYQRALDLSPNGTAIFSLRAGSYRVMLDKLPAECAVRDENPVVIFVNGGATSGVAFAVECTGAAGAPLLATALAAGGRHTCALDPSGTALCWGLNDYGQLGDGTTTAHTVPTPVAYGLRFVSLVAGDKHTCARTAEGRAYCWGANHADALDASLDAPCDPGDVFGESSACNRTPVEVGTDARFTQLAAGAVFDFGFTCGLTASGRAFCWGVNARGALGVSVPRYGSVTPVQVGGNETFQSVSAGGDHACGLTRAGTAFCWGANTSGELGVSDRGPFSDCSDNRVGQCATQPLPVTGGLTFAALSAAARSTCALDAIGQVFCWGTDGAGDRSAAPNPLATALRFVSLSVGSMAEHRCGIGADGSLACWGTNVSGQLGDGTRTDHRAPVQAAAGLAFSEVVTGRDHTCARTTRGTVYCWGSNDVGQLGPGASQFSLTPVAVLGPR